MLPVIPALWTVLHHVTWLLISVALCWACESKQMKDVLIYCSPHLGSVHTSILRTMDHNYTATCTEYVEYVHCIEKQMLEMCPQILRDGPLYKDFLHTKLIYQSKPFNCTLPAYVVAMEYNLHLNTMLITTTPSASGGVNLFSSSWTQNYVICAVLIGWLLVAVFTRRQEFVDIT